jgi:leucyl/phenylalanyl-tRNA--protein transferase
LVRWLVGFVSSAFAENTKRGGREQQQQQHRMPFRRKRPKSAAIEEFIPTYLRRWVHAYHGDFCVSRIFHPTLMAQLMNEGFLPIATPDVLLPKLHENRCVISLPEDLHISKSTRKKAKKFKMTLNQAFTRVVEGCREQHGEMCWLYPRLVEVFETMHRVEHTPAVVVDTGHACPVRIYSVEVWNVETGALAGGELGYSVGSVYTSLTGFCREDGAGSVQLAALGRLLIQQQFSLWDLGMVMDYKTSLGCRPMPRKEFVSHIHAVRYTKGHLTLPTTETRNCKDIIMYDQVVLLSQGAPTTKKGHEKATAENKTNPSKVPERAVKLPRTAGLQVPEEEEEEKKSDEPRVDLDSIP